MGSLLSLTHGACLLSLGENSLKKGQPPSLLLSCGEEGGGRVYTLGLWPKSLVVDDWHSCSTPGFLSVTTVECRLLLQALNQP
jgi:hypothetical protein